MFYVDIIATLLSLSYTFSFFIRLTIDFQLVLVANYSGISMFHGSVEGVERSREFDELNCQDHAIQLPKWPQRDICAGLVLSMNAILHDGALGDVLHDNLRLFEGLHSFACEFRLRLRSARQCQFDL